MRQSLKTRLRAVELATAPKILPKPLYTEEEQALRNRSFVRRLEYLKYHPRGISEREWMEKHYPDEPDIDRLSTVDPRERTEEEQKQDQQDFIKWLKNWHRTGER